MNISRRRFIRDAAGLAALAFAAPVSTSILLAREKTIYEQVESGVVEDQTFYLYEPIVLSFADRVEIHRCSFIAMRDMPTMLILPKEGRVWVSDCALQSNGYVVDVAIKVI